MWLNRHTEVGRHFEDEIFKRPFFEKVLYFVCDCTEVCSPGSSYFPMAGFMGPTWGPSGADRTRVGPMWAPWTFLSGLVTKWWWQYIWGIRLNEVTPLSNLQYLILTPNCLVTSLYIDTTLVVVLRHCYQQLNFSWPTTSLSSSALLSTRKYFSFWITIKWIAVIDVNLRNKLLLDHHTAPEWRSGGW